MMATAPRASDEPAHEPTRSAGDDALVEPGTAERPEDATVEPASERPTLLIAAAAACIVAAIAGAFGPWFEYERISDTNPDTWTTPGYQSGGLFIIAFGTAALVTLAAALLRDRGEPLAWVSFVGMALCTVIVFTIWTDPAVSTIPSGGTGTTGRLGWGPMVVVVAAPLAAVLLFLTARRLTAGDD